jgi:hypothetical protein
VLESEEDKMIGRSIIQIYSKRDKLRSYWIWVTIDFYVSKMPQQACSATWNLGTKISHGKL